MVKLLLYGFQETPVDLLTKLAKTLTLKTPNHFTSISVHNKLLPLPPGTYEPKRHQYQAEPFLHALRSQVPSSAHGLALINFDLFVSRLNFIFGVAQRGGHALVALPRLSPSFYGLSSNGDCYYQRIVKEAVHELGHVLGLDHCNNLCVMRFSNTLRDTDEKPEEYCSRCQQRI